MSRPFARLKLGHYPLPIEEARNIRSSLVARRDLARSMLRRLPGVGKVNEEKLAKLGVKTVGELRGWERANLEREFGRYGVRLYELARGIDENPVVPDRPTQSISVEDMFPEDVLLADTEPMIRRLAEKL